MIDVRTPVHPAVRRMHRQRRRRWWSTGLGVFTLLLAGGAVLPRLTPAPPPAPVVSTTPRAFGAVPVRPSASAPAPASTAARGPIPARGTGKFGYAPGRGKVLGTKGPVRRFRVAVEHGSGEPVAAFAAEVEATLGDKRSWTGGGRLRLQRVAGRDEHDFTVYLATRDTAATMCERGGVNIRIGGRPYTSCRTTGRAILNLDRWRSSAPTFTRAKVPLRTYRQYVINHEVGHELGKHHQGCPQRGGPAPVMVQQTLTLRGCTPNAWPRRGARELTGPSRF
ncbi:DUF3152 domain-containing protein [Jidongwangia harbinensis]|uniref:DUF3152 domain-containing protein n=1 Tax=Jidongwangia harbinensis TaxID=2878561 RepID=UPI001CD9DE2C|nr:DUF3152 domain-containing protein [Jidongwangia harbinensis]MCA2213046.1 DUF3152 domain-containing protein [Jidongwangia harbinensis]